MSESKRSSRADSFCRQRFPRYRGLLHWADQRSVSSLPFVIPSSELKSKQAFRDCGAQIQILRAMSCQYALRTSSIAGSARRVFPHPGRSSRWMALLLLHPHHRLWSHCASLGCFVSPATKTHRTCKLKTNSSTVLTLLQTKHRHLDYIGYGLLAAAATCFLMGLTWGGVTYPSVFQPCAQIVRLCV